MSALPFISSVEVPPSINVNKPFTVTFHGQWPTPGWNHTSTITDIDEKQRKMIIEYQGKSQGGLMMQVIKPFTTTVELLIPTKGEWTLIFKGKGDDFITSIEVTDI